jgi:hypothetical protein
MDKAPCRIWPQNVMSAPSRLRLLTNRIAFISSVSDLPQDDAHTPQQPVPSKSAVKKPSGRVEGKAPHLSSIAVANMHRCTDQSAPQSAPRTDVQVPLADPYRSRVHRRSSPSHGRGRTTRNKSHHAVYEPIVAAINIRGDSTRLTLLHENWRGSSMQSSMAIPMTLAN